jgi:hypothetical protein
MGYCPQGQLLQVQQHGLLSTGPAVTSTAAWVPYTGPAVTDTAAWVTIHRASKVRYSNMGYRPKGKLLQATGVSDHRDICYRLL